MTHQTLSLGKYWKLFRQPFMKRVSTSEDWALEQTKWWTNWTNVEVTEGKDIQSSMVDESSCLQEIRNLIITCRKSGRTSWLDICVKTEEYLQ